MNSAPSFGLALALALIFSASGLAAQPLTDDKVRAFVTTLKEAETLEEDFDDLNEDLSQAGQDGASPDFSSIFSDAVAQMRGHEAYERMESIVTDNGFDSMEDWGATGDRVFQAWMAVEMEQQHPEMAREMAAAMEEINNNPHLSEAQKEQMRSMMGGATAAMESARNAPEADKQAVRPHMNELRSVTGGDRSR